MFSPKSILSSRTIPDSKAARYLLGTKLTKTKIRTMLSSYEKTKLSQDMIINQLLSGFVGSAIGSGYGKTSITISFSPELWMKPKKIRRTKRMQARITHQISSLLPVRSLVIFSSSYSLANSTFSAAPPRSSSTYTSFVPCTYT